VPDEPQPESIDDASSTPSPGAAEDETPTAGGYSYTVVDDDDASAGTEAPSGRRLDWRWVLGIAALAIVPAIVVGALIWFFASSGGGDKKRTTADVSNLLNAFSQGRDGTISTRYEGQLPPSFPDGIPQYPGSRIVSSVSQIQGEDAGYLAVYDTPDSREQVSDYFAGELDKGDLQVVAGQDSRDATLHQYTKTDDANFSGLVLISSSKDNGLTTIVESVQITSGAKNQPSSPFAAEARQLPEGFPGDDVPTYGGAVVIESAYQKQSGTKTYAASFVTKDSASDVLDFYRGKFGDANLTVQDADSSSSTLKDAEAISFADPALNVQGQLTVGKFAEDESYTRIDVQVRTSK
jgi:hypothetical protein